MTWRWGCGGEGAFAPSRSVSFGNPCFTQFRVAHLAAGFAVQIQTVAIGWQVYDLTRDPFDLGLVGLSQFLPALVLVLVTGAVSDGFPRRTIMCLCLVGEALCAASFLVFTLGGAEDVRLVFLILVALGTARAFYSTARQSIVPNLVVPAHLANAITLNTTAVQVATLAGPVAGGLLYGIAPEAAYAAAFGLLSLAAVTVLFIPRPARRAVAEYPSWETLSAGFSFIGAIRSRSAPSRSISSRSFSAEPSRSCPRLSRPVAEYPKDGRQLLCPDDWFLLIGASDPAFLPPEPLADIAPTMLEHAESPGIFEMLRDLHRSDLEVDDRSGPSEPRAVPKTVEIRP